MTQHRMGRLKVLGVSFLAGLDSELEHRGAGAARRSTCATSAPARFRGRGLLRRRRVRTARRRRHRRHREGDDRPAARGQEPQPSSPRSRAAPRSPDTTGRRSCAAPAAVDSRRRSACSGRRRRRASRSCSADSSPGAPSARPGSAASRRSAASFPCSSARTAAAGCSSAACVVTPMWAKRIAGNGPPPEPTLGAYVRRLLFDTDEWTSAMKLAALCVRPFRTLLIGQTVSSLGDWMATFAFIALVYQQSGSPTAVGGILALRLLPAALGGPLAARRHVALGPAQDHGRDGPRARPAWSRSSRSSAACGGSICGASRSRSRASCSCPRVTRRSPISSTTPISSRERPGARVVVRHDPARRGDVRARRRAARQARSSAARSRSVFWIDAVTFLVSAAMIARIRISAGRRPSPAVPANAASAEASVAAARRRASVSGSATRSACRSCARSCPRRSRSRSASARCSRSGSRSSATVLHASNAEFGVLVALFGVGAAAGSSLLQRVGQLDELRTTRLGVLALGGIVAVLQPVARRSASRSSARSRSARPRRGRSRRGWATLQSQLDGHERILAFAAFHIVIRTGSHARRDRRRASRVSSSALCTGPWSAGSSRRALVLFCSGIVVAMSALWGRKTGEYLHYEAASHADDKTEGARCPSPS